MTSFGRTGTSFFLLVIVTVKEKGFFSSLQQTATLDKLRYALKKTISRGLKLAILTPVMAWA